MFAPFGLKISQTEKTELESIARATAGFLKRIDEWYKKEQQRVGGSRWLGILHGGIPKEFAEFPWKPGLPETIMVDLVSTTDGWRIVEIDATNRNGLGFPALWRHLYELPALWGANHEYWLRRGWRNAVQIMSSRHRFYEPYYRFFLKLIDGKLVREEDIGDWLANGVNETTHLLDLPILYAHRDDMRKLLSTAEHMPMAIPPKHYLSNKAVLALPWEEEDFASDKIREYLPTTRLLCRSRPLPTGDFFVKLLMGNGAHGTYDNHTDKLAELHKLSKPQAVWQEALPIVRRRVKYLNEDGDSQGGDFFLRFTIFISDDGIIRDADVTGSQSKVVHGSKTSLFTVPIV